MNTKKILDKYFYATLNAQANIDACSKEIDRQVLQFWTNLALFVAKKHPDWYMDFSEYGSRLLEIEKCQECIDRLKELGL